MKVFLFLISLFISNVVFADQSSLPWVTNQQNVVMYGYDPVAYFMEGEATQGSSDYALLWDGVTWWFSSASNRDRFKADPVRYAPQFGAHCANGLSDGHVVNGDPENWRIIDGKLYLFFSAWGRMQWAFNVDEQIGLAHATWSKYLNQQARLD